MKILHLIYSEGVYGAEKYLTHLLPGLNKQGFECHLIVVSSKRTANLFNDYCDEFNRLNVQTILLIANFKSFIFTAKKINKYLKDNKIKIVHSHLIKADLIAASLKILFNPRIYLISTKHGYQEKYLLRYVPGKRDRPNDLFYFVTKFTLQKIDKNIAVSKGIANLFFDIGLSKTVYPFIYNGINVDPLIGDKDTNQCKRVDAQLIIVGRIELIKGLHFLIDALPIITAAFPKIKLLVLGEGSEKYNCIERANRLGLQKFVEFLGFKSNPHAYIYASDIIILPSLFEPFGLVYIEAFALKTAVVAFNTPAGNEIMVNNETAMLVDKGDSRALAETIIYLLNNQSEMNGITERAYKKYNECFTTEIMVKKMAAWYLSLEL